MNKHSMPAMDAAAEDRLTDFGKRLTAGLDEAANTLPTDITERLRFAREQAVRKAREARAAAPLAAEQSLRMGSTLALKGGDRTPRWFKLASLGPLLLLLLGLLLIQHSQWYQQILAAAEVDTAMLAKPLPPAAYSDPGFQEYLDEHPDEQQERHEE